MISDLLAQILVLLVNKFDLLDWSIFFLNGVHKLLEILIILANVKWQSKTVYHISTIDIILAEPFLSYYHIIHIHIF